jgi:hypothetical protein
MSKIYYPFSQNVQEHSATHENIRIYKRDFILSDMSTRVINSIEIDLNRLKIRNSYLSISDLQTLSDILLESIFSIDVTTEHIDRRTGKTTKLVDRWVQEFFEKGITYIYEGRDKENQMHLNMEALERFKKRMASEHSNIDFDITTGNFSGITCFKVTKK